jgi:hypothetical protein
MTEAVVKSGPDPGEKQSTDALSSQAAVALVTEGIRRFRIRAQVVTPLQRAWLVMGVWYWLAVTVAFSYVLYSVSPFVWRGVSTGLMIHDMLNMAVTVAFGAILLGLGTAAYAGPWYARLYYRHVATRTSVVKQAHRLILQDDPCPTFAKPMAAYEFYEAFGRVLHPAALDSAGWVDNVCTAARAQTVQEKARALAEALVLGCGVFTPSPPCA